MKLVLKSWVFWRRLQPLFHTRRHHEPRKDRLCTRVKSCVNAVVTSEVDPERIALALCDAEITVWKTKTQTTRRPGAEASPHQDLWPRQCWWNQRFSGCKLILLMLNGFWKKKNRIQKLYTWSFIVNHSWPTVEQRFPVWGVSPVGRPKAIARGSHSDAISDLISFGATAGKCHWFIISVLFLLNENGRFFMNFNEIWN